MEIVFILGGPVFFLALGWFVGRHRERSHIESLNQREAALHDMLVTQLMSFPHATQGDLPPRIMIAETVIASDYLKTFLAGLRNLVGGEVRSFESLLVRARREATLRILEEARSNGYNAICNLRMETADIGGNTATSGGGNKGMVMAAILATATAYYASGFPLPKPPKPSPP